MIEDRASYVAQLPRGRNEVAPHVPAHEAVDQIDQCIENQQPGEEEVPAPACGEVLISRQGQPKRKRVPLFVCGTRQAQETRGIERVPQNVRNADLASLLLFSPNRRNWLREVGRLHQKERRMNLENLPPAEQQHGPADDPRPNGSVGSWQSADIRSQAVSRGRPRLFSVDSSHRRAATDTGNNGGWFSRFTQL